MKVVQFTIPVSQEHSIMVQEDKLPHFYNHLHRHNETQITWIIKGEGILTLDQIDVNLKIGQIIAIPINLEHALRNESQLPVELLTFFTPPLI